MAHFENLIAKKSSMSRKEVLIHATLFEMFELF